MLLTEYNPKKHIRQEREEAREEGREEGWNSGCEYGRQEGVEQGLQILIETYQELGMEREQASTKVMSKFQMSEQETHEAMGRYWKL